MFQSIGRMQVIAANVFREVLRDRVLYLLGLYAIGMALAAQLLPQLSAMSGDKVIVDVGLGMMHLLGVLLAIFVGTGLVNKEIEKRTVLVLMAKPVSRVEFIVGKHLGLSAVLGLLVVAMTLIYGAVLFLSRIPYDWVATVISSGCLWLLLSLITAIAIGFGVFTSSLLAITMTIAVCLMGSVSQDMVALGKLTQNPLIERTTRILYLILPDFARLDLKNQVVYGLLPPLESLLQNVGYGMLYIVLVLGIAAAIFSMREF